MNNIDFSIGDLILNSQHKNILLIINVDNTRKTFSFYNVNSRIVMFVHNTIRNLLLQETLLKI